jgi:hypothetical protein
MDLEQPPYRRCFYSTMFSRTDDNSASTAAAGEIGTGPRLKTAAYDDGTDESLMTSEMVPPGVDLTGTVTFELWWDAVDSTDDVVWVLDHLPLEDGEDWADWAGGQSTVALATDTASAAGTLVSYISTTATVSSLGWVANDMLTLRLRRDANAIADDLPNDAFMIMFCYTIPVVR